MDRSESLYDVDFHAWTQEQARRLRDAAEGRSNLNLDWAKLAEEIESMGSEQRHALGSAIRLILLHFLKLAHSPARDPRRGWFEEVSEYRIQMQSRLEDSPGLRQYLPDLLSRGWRDARKQAVQALRRDRVSEADIPEACPFTLEQVMDPDFFPANRHGLE